MRMFRTWRVGLGVGGLLIAGWALAADPVVEFPACDRTPTAADIEGAKGAHKAATQFYERADYDRAIQYWKDAYNFDCTAHPVLINIANAYEKKGARAEAISVLETYLARAPNAPNASNIQAKIDNLKASLKPTATPTQTVTAPPTTTVVPTTTAAPTTTESAPPPTGPRPYGYTPLIVAGGGGVLALGGGVLTAIGLSAVSDAESQCPERVNCSQEVTDQGNAGRTQGTIGVILLGFGVAGAAGGLVWHFVFNNPTPASPPPETTTGVQVTPVTSPGFAGVSVHGKF